MLKNTKVLYGIISVLLVICILCGIHIAKERSMMYEHRTYFVTQFSAITEGVLDWTRNVIEAETSDEIMTSLPHAKHYLESLIELSSLSTRGVFVYNSLLTEKTFFGGGITFYYDLKVINNRFEEIQQNFSENGKLSEEDLAYLKAVEEAFSYLFERLETNGVINIDAVRSDTYLSNVCGNFCYMMLNK